MDIIDHWACNGHVENTEKTARLPVNKGNLDGQTVYRTFWRPTAQELELLQEGGCVMLALQVEAHPKVNLGVLP